ncbi:hypothetical protein EYF80_047911 [Liparis tanakae]|uniref:Uncharacterized protein n=1 Tax=Liparis tanakae TaxID=230148 RepID=A0A4Z2FLY0_9TELE|nr:hypothetical protein EYF80_047911 [Liparis tanakae]
MATVHRHVEVGHQEVHVVPLFGLEGLGDEARGVPVLAAPHGDAVDLQDHLADLQLPAVVGRAPPLREGEREGEAERERERRGWRVLAPPSMAIPRVLALFATLTRVEVGSNSPG